MTQKRKILLSKQFSDEHLARLREETADFDFLYEDLNQLNDETLSGIYAVLGWSDEYAARFEALSKLELGWIQTFSAGVDSLNQDWMKKHGIYLTTSSGVHGYSIRESVFAMLLAIGRGVVHSVKHQLKNEWNSDFDPDLLQGKTMMIFGTGAIGESIARLAVNAFDMKTIGVNRSGRAVAHMHEVLTSDKAMARIGEADVIVAILPLTDESRHFFNRDFFSRMKDGSIFVNAGRGASVVTGDLIEALKAGIPAYAALDVTDPEPLPSDHELWALPNVLITPHISGKRPDYNDRVLEIILENIDAITKNGQPSRNVVDYDRRY